MARLEKYRIRLYWTVALPLTLFYVAMRGSHWQGGAQLHTVMEVAATLLASLVGILSLMQFYAHNDNTFLLVGTGFLAPGCVWRI